MSSRNFPESYKDDLYASLDARTEQKLGLPSGLLSNVRERGERSNHSQQSEAGASTVYQFIPSTKKAILDKYGIDVSLSPENASEGAGLLLKEGLSRNGGDPAAAVGEYIGGLDRKNWGPTTKSYVNRVMTGLRGSTSSAEPAQGGAQPSAAPGKGGSTFDRVMASMPKRGVEGPQIAQVFQAYQSGQMTPEEASEFEQDVKSGAVLLPRGASLSASANAPAGSHVSAFELPPAVEQAYRMGTMPAADRADLERDLAAGLVKLPSRAEIPAAVAPGAEIPAATAPILPKQDTTIGDKIVGAGETALSTVTGLTGGTAGAAGGMVVGLTKAALSGEFGTQQAADMVEQHVVAGQRALTYAPRTYSGQEQTEAVGRVMAETLPVAPMTAEMGALATAGKQLKPSVAAARQAAFEALPEAVQSTTRSAANAVKAGAAAVTAPISSATGKVRAALASKNTTSYGPRSVGAAETGVAELRRANAQDLPVPIDLTEGQATREHGQQQFERETAKTALGAPLRERFMEQNEKLLQNFEHFVDQTGAAAPNLRAVGATVDGALVKQFQADKNRVRVKYAAAERSDEAKALVDHESPVTVGEGDGAVTSTPIGYLNEQPSGLPNTGVADAARQYAVKLGIAAMEDGQLVPRPATIGAMEKWRRAIGDAAGHDPSDVRTATIMKKLIDGQTEPVAGPLFREARAERRRLAENYENRSVINKLLTKKRGTEDRQVALEDVFSHSILDGSLDDVRNVRRVLHRGGEEGHQAWRELQGATLTHIKEEVTKNVARDSNGNPIVSAAAMDRVIRKLDTDGKLDFVFGKRGAEKLRTLNDLAKDIYTSPPGSVNTSNTASVILAALDMSMSGMAGVPMPVASGLRMIANKIKDKNLSERVRQSLGDTKKAPEKF